MFSVCLDADIIKGQRSSVRTRTDDMRKERTHKLPSCTIARENDLLWRQGKGFQKITERSDGLDQLCWVRVFRSKSIFENYHFFCPG